MADPVVQQIADQVVAMVKPRPKQTRALKSVPKAKAATAMTAKRAEVFSDEAYETIHGHKPFKPTKLTVEGALDYFYDHFCAKKKSAARDASIIRHFKARWSGRLLSGIATDDILAFK